MHANLIDGRTFTKQLVQVGGLSSGGAVGWPNDVDVRPHQCLVPDMEAGDLHVSSANSPLPQTALSMPCAFHLALIPKQSQTHTTQESDLSSTQSQPVSKTYRHHIHIISTSFLYLTKLLHLIGHRSGATGTRHPPWAMCHGPVSGHGPARPDLTMFQRETPRVRPCVRPCVLP